MHLRKEYEQNMNKIFLQPLSVVKTYQMKSFVLSA